MAITPQSVHATREVLSRRLQELGRSTPPVELPAGLVGLDRELGDGHSISHFLGPDAGGAGWGELEFERALGEIGLEIFSPGSLALHQTVRLLRPTLRLGGFDALDGARSSKALQDGLSRRLPHNGLGFFRGSKSYVEDAADGVIRERAFHELTLTTGGAYFEREATNLLARSSAISQTTGLTLTGTGVNGSAIGATTGEIFDSAITAYCWYFTSGNPHTTNLYATWPTTASVAGGTVCCFSIDASANVAGNLEWRLARAIDGWYYNATSDTWQALSVWTTIACTTTVQRFYEAAINVGAGATTLTLDVGLTSGHTADRTYRVHHVQLEGVAWPSTRMVYDNGTFTRQLDAYTYANGNTSRRAWPAARGTLLYRWTPNASAAWVAGATNNFAHVRVAYDANNSIDVFYRGATGVLRAVRTSGGVATTINGAHSIARGTEIAIGLRWATETGLGDGELDAAYGAAASGSQNFDLWINGAAVAQDESVMPVQGTASDARVEIGHNASDGSAADGLLRQIRILPIVLPDALMARWMA